VPELSLAGSDLDGLRIHYVEAGYGPVTVLVHGVGGFAESWRRTMQGLVSNGRIVALDLPGFGGSSKPRRPYQIGFLARSVAALVDRLDIDRARLVGHSLGGAVAAACAALFPDRIERLALLGAAVPGFPLRPAIAYRLLMIPGLGELMARMVSPGLCAAALTRCQVAPDPKEVAFFVGYRFDERSTAEARAAYLAAVRSARHDFTRGARAWREALERLDIPVLVIHGRQDPIVPIAHARSAVAGLRHAEARWIDRCGHFPQLEHAAEVNGRLSEFLYARMSPR
jgi:pimeloyl-ACP methyl ester carboxylesterase